jgi:hypothetical protein
MSHHIAEKTTLTDDEQLELATHICNTFALDPISIVFNGGSYEDSKQLWHEIYLDALDRALRAGRIFIIYDSAGKIASSAVAFPPGATVDSSKDANNVHFKYVEQHTTPEQAAFVNEVGLTESCLATSDSSQYNKLEVAVFTGQYKTLPQDAWREWDLAFPLSISFCQSFTS